MSPRTSKKSAKKKQTARTKKLENDIPMPGPEGDEKPEYGVKDSPDSI